jgi:cytochrome c peroxidase
MLAGKEHAMNERGNTVAGVAILRCRRLAGFAALCPLALLAACAAPSTRAQTAPENPLPFSLPAGLDLHLPAAADIPFSTARVALGRRLFFDPRLSRDGTLSCASCHRPELAFADGRTVPVGIAGAEGKRNTPTLVNRAYGALHFWDGRAASLPAQVLEPIADPLELGLEVEAAIERLSRDPGYRRAFRQAVGDVPTPAALAAVLAAYVASIIAGDAPFDRYTAGDTLALSFEARHGRRLFVGRANCATCHVGPNFTDERFHNTGVAWRTDVPADSGRYRVTREPRHLGAFKTPTLREVARTAPYMHDGSLATLEEVIEFYDRGGHPNPHLDPEIRPLRLLPEEKGALVAFLRTLSGIVREGGNQARPAVRPCGACDAEKS